MDSTSTADQPIHRHRSRGLILFTLKNPTSYENTPSLSHPLHRRLPSSVLAVCALGRCPPWSSAGAFRPGPFCQSHRRVLRYGCVGFRLCPLCICFRRGPSLADTEGVAANRGHVTRRCLSRLAAVPLLARNGA